MFRSGNAAYHIHLSLSVRMRLAAMAEVISYELFKQRKERWTAAKEMEDRQKRIRRIIGYAEKYCNWGNDDNRVDNE